jgi:glycosyltransferase involved in cell wall biosynthesis
MKIIFLTHPDFLGHKSMPRYTTMLASGMESRGHNVEVWAPKGVLVTLAKNATLRKWLGYLDQYVLFSLLIRWRLRTSEENDLFVLIDNALGPWVPFIKKRPHVVHCHDFLAQFSAMGLIKINLTSFTGKLYQRFIRHGLFQARNFISVSLKTKSDLIKLLPQTPAICEVVYNGLNQQFTEVDPSYARGLLGKLLASDFTEGFILHVGGNQWYKNKISVIETYIYWRSYSEIKLPLLLIGEKASSDMLQKARNSKFSEDIYFLEEADNEQVRLAYYGARLFVFPSLAEGFGWPIAEAMATGCPVITTDADPMREVAGNAGFLVPVMPESEDLHSAWIQDVANIIEHVITMPPAALGQVCAAAVKNSERFDTAKSLDKMEEIYVRIIKSYQSVNKTT